MRFPVAFMALAAVALFLCVPFIAVDSSGADGGAGSTHPIEIDGDTDVHASGTCSDNGTWYYERTSNKGYLTLNGGYVQKISDGKWTLKSLTIDSVKVEGDDLKLYSVRDVIIRDTLNLTVGSGVTAADGAMRDLRPSKVTFGEGFTTVQASMFYLCSTLHTVDFGGVTSIGAEAFHGCSLSNVDIGKATVDHTSFNGCSNLKKIEAKGSTHYDSIDGMLYTKDGKVLYMVPPGLKDVVKVTASQKLETVNLSYADAIIAVDNIGRLTPVTFVDVIENTKTRGISYSSLGMETCRLTPQVKDVMINYTLYDGWTVDPDSVSRSGAEIKFYEGGIRVSDFKGCIVLPMGVCTLTYQDIADMDEMDGWSVDVTDAPTGTGTAKDLDRVGVQVIGYKGDSEDATLSGTMVHHGVVCSVDSVKMAPGALGHVVRLTIGEGITIGEDAFANAMFLRSVTADHATSVGKGAFRFCTSLEDASFRSCRDFGDRAFEMCWGLNSIVAPTESVTFGKGTFNGCTSLGVISVAYDTVVSGVPDGVSILRYDAVNNPDIVFEAVDDLLVIYNEFSDHVVCSGDAQFSDPKEYEFYYDDRAIVPLEDEMYIRVVAGVGTSGYLVAFDAGMGLDVEYITVPFGDMVVEYEPDSVFGYRFLGWYLDGYEYDFSQAVERSMVLTGEWAKNDPVDPIPMYLLAILAVSVGASVFIIGLARREIKRY